jgi:hypothetical protein
MYFIFFCLHSKIHTHTPTRSTWDVPAGENNISRRRELNKKALVDKRFPRQVGLSAIAPDCRHEPLEQVRNCRRRHKAANHQ